MGVFAIFIIIIPVICIPYIFYNIFVSIWWGFILYDKNKKDNLKWDIQRIIVASITAFNAYLSVRIIYDDIYNYNVIYTPLDTVFLKLLIYPLLLLIYYIVLFISYYKTYLNNNTFKEILYKDLNNDHTGKKYIKFSWFILASMVFSIWWVFASWLSIGLGGLAQN